MSNTLVHETTVDGSEIAPIIADIEDSLGGYPRDHVIIALVSMALIITYPEITPEQLQKAVRDVSHYICLALEDSPALDPTQMN